MIQKATISGFVVAAAIFGLFVPFDRLFDAFQPLTVALSIMAAALLVRLNRGMPTLEWKSVEPEARKRLTAAIVSVTREYMMIAAICAALLLTLLALTTVGKPAAQLWIEPIQRSLSALVGSMVALCVGRMAYVVWRDYDIVRVQKALVDAAADKEEREAQAAVEKVADMRETNIRSVPSSAPKAWDA
jgi:hypothetical protein